MKAVLLNGVTPVEQVTLSEVEIPKVRPGWVLVQVKAFGMNHSEKILRLQEIENEYIQKPIIPGIECVGTEFDFSEIKEACVALDSGKVNGKIVVKMTE